METALRKVLMFSSHASHWARKVFSMRALEHGYIETSGERKTKTGFAAKLYQPATRAYLAVLLNRTNLDDFVEKAPNDKILCALAAFF